MAGGALASAATRSCSDALDARHPPRGRLAVGRAHVAARARAHAWSTSATSSRWSPTTRFDPRPGARARRRRRARRRQLAEGVPEADTLAAGSRRSRAVRRRRARPRRRVTSSRICCSPRDDPLELRPQAPRWPSDEALDEGRAHRRLDAEAAARVEGRARGRPARAPRERARGVVRDLRAQEGGARRPRLPRPAAEGARRAPRQRRRCARYFAARFRFLIVDEFQDTDPLQVEIAAAPDRRATRARSSWWATRSSRSTASGAPSVALFRELGREAADQPGRRPSAPDPELPLAARHPALREPRVRRADPGLATERTSPPTSPSLRRPACRRSPRSSALRFEAAVRRRGETCSRAEAAALAAFVAASRPRRRTTVRDPVERRAAAESCRRRHGPGAAPDPDPPLEEALEAAGARASRSRAASRSSIARRSTRPSPSCARSTTRRTASPSWRRCARRSSA